MNTTVNTKPLFMQSDDEILDNAATVLEEINLCPISYEQHDIRTELTHLVRAIGGQFNGDQYRTMLTALYNAETYFGLPIWWDTDRVSVNGCHVDLKQFQGDRQKARIWSSIKAVSVYANMIK